MGSCFLVPENRNPALDREEMPAMEIWPYISRKSLKECKSGAIVHIVGSHFDNLPAIVCEDNDTGKGLIYLGDNDVVYWLAKDPGSIEVFSYDGDPVLLLDHKSATTSYSYHKTRKTIGLVAFVESGCYMNVSLATEQMRPEFRYHFESARVSPAYESDKGNSVVFRNWSLVLTNPDIPHAKPLEIFSMKSK